MAHKIQLESMFNALAETVATGGGGEGQLRELFDSLKFMLQREDQGWQVLQGAGSQDSKSLAISLDDLKNWEREISELSLGAAWMGRGFRLRYAGVFQGGIRRGNIPAGGSQGVPNIARIVNDRDNQREFFGSDAKRRLEHRFFYSGIGIFLANDKTKKLKSIPLSQITDQILDPEDRGVIWALKREWTERDLTTGKTTERKAWIFTNDAIGNRVKKIKEEGSEDVEVLQNERLFIAQPTRLDGMAYGTPDALAAASWHHIARSAFLDGVSLSAALAQFAYTVSSKSGRGAAKASVELASPVPAGSTAVIGQNELQAVAGSGKAYEFSKLTSLLAVVATALDVSVIHLSSAPGDAGSSYSASETLDLPQKQTMSARRDVHIGLEVQVLKWLGVKEPDVSFVPYGSGAETYRAVQAYILAAVQAGIYSPQELRDQIDDLFAFPNGVVPDGTMPWNNIHAEQERAEMGAKVSAANSANTSVASPAQGRSNGSGGQSGAANDLRTDGVSD